MTGDASRPLSRRWRDHLSLRAQLVGFTALLAAIVGLGLVIVVQVLLAGAADSTSERVLIDRTDALVAGIDSGSSRAIRVPRALLDPGVAVFDEDGRRIAGTVPPSMREEFEDLSRARRTRIVEGGEHFAIMARPFTTATGNHGVVVITEPIGPYERNERAALLVSIVSAALLVLMAAGSAAWISKRVLSPVEEMAKTADEWSERDLERRFSLGPPTNEIRALGNTLDGLLDKVASVIRAEQRLTSELAHELRTPLTAIRGTADLMMLRTDLDDEARADLGLISDASASMSNTITMLLDIARRESSELRTERTDLKNLADKLQRLPLPVGTVHTDLPAGIFVAVPEALAVRALAPIITNALEICGNAWVGARIEGRRVELQVADCGEGVSEALAQDLFEPGWSNNGGSGLGLALARRVARSGGGDVTLRERRNVRGGATFVVTFPGGGLPEHHSG